MPTKRATVAQAIRDAITAGAYEPGTKLPSENELAQEYSASRETIRVALTTLAHEGWIFTEQGRGAVVRDRRALVRVAGAQPAHHERGQAHQSQLAEAEQAGMPPSIRTKIYMEFADQHTAAALEIPTNEEVLVRDVVTSIGSEVIQLATSRYPRTLTRDTPIEQEDTGAGGVLGRFEDAGHTIAGHTERVSLHRASADEAAALRAPAGSACLRIERITRSNTGRVLEVATMILVDRYVLLYEIPAG